MSLRSRSTLKSISDLLQQFFCAPGRLGIASVPFHQLGQSFGLRKSSISQKATNSECRIAAAFPRFCDDFADIRRHVLDVPVAGGDRLGASFVYDPARIEMGNVVQVEILVHPSVLLTRRMNARGSDAVACFSPHVEHHAADPN